MKSYSEDEVRSLMTKKWNTQAKKKALREKYQVTESYISHMFRGSKPPCFWLLAELKLVKTTVYAQSE